MERHSNGHLSWRSGNNLGQWTPSSFFGRINKTGRHTCSFQRIADGTEIQQKTRIGPEWADVAVYRRYKDDIKWAGAAKKEGASLTARDDHSTRTCRYQRQVYTYSGLIDQKTFRFCFRLPFLASRRDGDKNAIGAPVRKTKKKHKFSSE